MRLLKKVSIARDNLEKQISSQYDLETFAAVRELKRELVELHKDDNGEDKHSKMQHFGEILSDIVMPDLETTETESSLELNFIIGKIKHSVKRVKRQER